MAKKKSISIVQKINRISYENKGMGKTINKVVNSLEEVQNKLNIKKKNKER